jgi:eukaryotic-like serine/threonine-protein kinase
MNEDPTIAISLGQGQQPERLDAPSASTTWGDFNLLERVGVGGFGEVYRAWDPNLQREVALKLLLPGVAGGEAEYQAMLREARALASVRHPNIVPVYGIDRHDGRVGFWTDFVRGKTLSVLVGEQGTFGAREAALIGLDVARALSAVHRAGLLHRDIKAENVMREEGGRILLMDFGLSALDQRESNIAGTPNYMAPELFEGGQTTAGTDLYALGVLLYFLVSGEYPVRLSGLTRRGALEEFPKRKPLMDLRPDLPESLLRTVSAALEMDPARRFSSAGQLASALAESLGTNEPTPISVAPDRAEGQRAREKWILAGLLAVVALGLPIAWYGTHRNPSKGTNGADSTLSGTANDQFLRAQDLLLRSYKESNLAEAVKGFQEVLKTDPENALAQARLGEAYFAQHGYAPDPKLLDMAKEAADRATALNPALAAPHVTLACIAAAQGDTQLATQYVQKALELDPRSAEAHGALGDVYGAQGRGGDAIAGYQKAIDLAPDDWRWPMSMGVAQFKQGNLTAAIAQFQRGAELAPDNAMAFYDLSIAHRQAGHLDQARMELQHSLDLDPTARKYAALGSLLLFEGKFDESAEMEKKAIGLNRNNFEAFEDLSAAYQWSGAHHQEAMEALKQAVALEEAEHATRRQDPVLLATLADNYAALGDSTRSLVLARQALALASDNPTVCYKTGEAFETLGQRQAAIPLIAKALANGYNAYEFEHNPQLASLRADQRFRAMLDELKQKKK